MDSRTDHLVRKLRLRHLELLVALSETATMRSAAARLHLSQPALSKMLGEVEACFGARLFDRSHQGMQPNALGASAAYRARAALHELERATEEVSALQRGAVALLRLGAPSVTAAVPAAVAELRRQMPGAVVQIREGRVHELIQRLLAGELDCVFGAVTPELLTSDLTPRLEPVLMLEDELCVLTAGPPPPAAMGSLRWADLRDSPWMVPPRDTLVRQAFMTAFLNDAVPPPAPVIEVMSSVTIGALLRADPQLLCAVRREHASDELARGGVCRLEVLPRVPLPSFGLFQRRDDLQRPRVLGAFAQALRRVSGTPPPARRGARRARPADAK
ncbi:LysR substrate-binding domain-containing protein [uncultured Pseudacidovorax sp.]|uniref:LysR substrate-binding domain-containing protein n=1 Tax=uncultured Pseudacidovorax sp. TaxID=679313 RepID=UPI0025ECDB2C|nr:LysR substrate-binding domain-containing protein [uncultured Pseudacidovorax sp.]